MKRLNDCTIKSAVFAVLCALLSALGGPQANAAGLGETAKAYPLTAQFCWAVGKYDDTIYYAEIEGREDRSASFVEFVEITGVVHAGVSCRTQGTTEHEVMKVNLFRFWHDAELNVVDTTFLSDLDY